ncbi:MAG: hypothetical protein AMXMBFR64_24390 [Myxococcales bacterium]
MLLLGLGVALAHGPARGEDAPWPAPVEPVSPYYNGTWLSIVAGGGIGLLADEALDGRIGGGVEVGGRMALVLQLVDLELMYRYGHYAVTSDATDVTLHRHSIIADVKIHPLFLIVMAGNHLLAGLYVQTGVSAELADARAPSAGVDELVSGAGVHVGCGFDLPLTPPNAGSSLWIGLNYRANFTTLDPPSPLDDLDEHLFAIQLHYRHNNLQYGHVPRPPDFGF